MKVIRFLLNPILVILSFFLYLYLILYCSISYLSVDKVIDKIDFSNFYGEYQNSDINLSQQQSDKIESVIKEVIINSIYKSNYSSKDVLNLIDSNIEELKGGLNIPNEIINPVRSELFLGLNEVKNNIMDFKEKNNIVETLSFVDNVFSHETSNIAIIALCGCLFVLMIINSKFSWIKYNAITMILSGSTYVALIKIIEKFISSNKAALFNKISGMNNAFSGIIDYIINLLNEAKSLSFYLIIVAIISIIVYKFVFKPLVNKK